MIKVKCINCKFSLNVYCVLSGDCVGQGTEFIECDDYEEYVPDYDGMDLTDSELYIRGELSSQDSEAW